MKLTFLGTRGYIDPVTPEHRMHTATLVSFRKGRVMLDCGRDWLGHLDAVRPQAVLVTHAHPDHAFGLEKGAPCPVHATAETWEGLAGFDITAAGRKVVEPRRPVRIAGITFEAFPVLHSVRAPAVGYRITAGRVAVFYVPDVVWIPDRAEAFAGIRAYVGDGATLTRNMVRRHRRTGELFGHATVRQQLTWCRDEGVPLMVVTHCGSDIVAGDPAAVAETLHGLAAERGVRVEVARDGMEKVLR